LKTINRNGLVFSQVYLNFYKFWKLSNQFELFKLILKENLKGHCAPWAGFYLAHLLGPAWPKLAAHDENRGGRGALAMGARWE
jgi:hypothetical protein